MENNEEKQETPAQQPEAPRKSIWIHTPAAEETPQDNNFNEEEMQHLKDIFDLFDKDKAGAIEINDLEAIMSSLNRNPAEARAILEQVKPADPDHLNFDEFVNLISQVEQKLDEGGDADKELGAEAAQQISGVVNIQADSKVVDFLRLLEEYRRKCEAEGNYAEAKKAKLKFDELMRKETIRQKNNIRSAQEQELQNIEQAQKAQFLEFSQAWDNYMSDYEATAYLSLEKLKEKHLLEFQQF